jgi:hypothetical protein
VARFHKYMEQFASHMPDEVKAAAPTAAQL